MHDPDNSPLHWLRRLIEDLPGLIGDRVHLLTLELHRASLALVQVVVLVLAAALFGATAWFGLWIGIGAWVIALGVDWGWVAGGIVVVNLLLAALAVRRAISLAPLLTLPATVRRLTSARKASRALEQQQAEPQPGEEKAAA